MERPEVESLIDHQVAGKSLPSEVVEHIVEKSDGVPLFVEELTKTARESDFLCEEKDCYTLTGSLSDLSIPATLQDSLMARLDRFPTLRELAQRGAVLGREFTYQALHLLSNLDEQDLIHGLEQLVANEILYQRGRPPRSRYIFKHALIQDAAYRSLLRRTRQQIHQQVASSMVKQVSEQADTHPELIAHHYAQAGCHEQAVDYYQQAGDVALARSANVEAATHLEKSLECLRELPESTARQERELYLQMALGPALVAGRGFGDSGVAEAYARAWQLCQQLGNRHELPIVLRGRQILHMLRGELQESRQYAGELMDLGERQDDPALVVGGCHALGQTEFFLGNISNARSIVARGIGIFDAKKHRLPNWPGGQPGEQCFLYSCFSLWMLGYPAQSLENCEQALRLANELAKPDNLVNTLAFAAALHVMREDFDSGLRQAEATVELGTEQSNPTFLGMGLVFHGWWQVARNLSEEGIAEIDRGVTTFQSSVAKGAWLSYLFGLQAESYGRMERFDDGHTTISMAIDQTKSTGLNAWLAELYRIKGDLLHGSHPNDAGQAEAAYIQALEIARDQQAKSWELRAAVHLARLWQSHGKEKEARDLLSPVYDWFSEGFDTADLHAAKTLLEEIA